MNLSIFLPSIRPFYLENLYKSAILSCKRYNFEFVIASPFDLPDSLKEKNNIKLIKTYAHPTKAAQLAAIKCDGDLIYHTTDDVLFIENSIDSAIDQYKEICKKDDVISMRYTESINHEDKNPYSLSYWTVANSCPVPGLDPSWNINVHFLMAKESFIKYGGFDCIFEYLTQAGADLLIRMQKNGSKVFHSKYNVSTADWSGGSKGKEHLPIQIAQERFDTPMFWHIWSSQLFYRKEIDIKNYENYPDVWERRFKSTNVTKYEDLE